MNGIIQEQNTLQKSWNRQGLATTPPSFIQNAVPNDRLTRQTFLTATLDENELAAEREHEHWGLNE